jgi:hypothetical protein
MRRRCDSDRGQVNRVERAGRRRGTSGALLALWLPLIAACSTEATLRAGGRSWLWGLAPIALFAAVQGPAFALDRWRRGRGNGRLGAGSYLAGLALVAAATLVFVACNFAVAMPPEGKLANVAAWFGGALVAAAGGMLVERRAAAATKTVAAVRLSRKKSI